MTTPEDKSMFAVRDGVGVINFEAVSTDVDFENVDAHGNRYRRRGMRIDAGSGWSLSVVFGVATYSDNHDACSSGEWHEESSTAEIAVLPPTGQLSDIFEGEWGDTVKGYCRASEVLYWLIRLRSEVRSMAQACS